MCVRVHQRASRCPLFAKVVLATDDERIMAVAKAWNVPALLTRRDHQSGTDRVLEAARLLGAEAESVVVNVQGDEPALEPAMLEELLAPFAGPDGACVQVATLATPMSRQEALKRFRRGDLEHVLEEHAVRLLSGGLDEVPMAYKDIRAVMAAQADLVRIRATFTPRIVKMAP